MKLNREGKIYTILFTFIVSFVFVFLLSAVNSLTVERSRNNQELFKIKALLNAFGIPFSSNEDAFEKFSKFVQRFQPSDIELYRTVLNGEEMYAYVFQGNGLWGPIVGVIAVDSKVNKIFGIDFISQSETPGLGARIEEKWFKEQFRGKNVQHGLIVTRTRTGAENEVDAITGATSTSKAVERIVNDALNNLRKTLGVRP
ncbi:FMN-binding protein [Pseudothermotoga sp.]|nr:FMN-binding protein [Pseudothermotoga sp.]MCX7813710.1 FMN-binding protein [Pseudothermotoga sp.]MDW8139443.1 FMN-binding protein [Pseudothermotoga sp.]